MIKVNKETSPSAFGVWGSHTHTRTLRDAASASVCGPPWPPGGAPGSRERPPFSCGFDRLQEEIILIGDFLCEK